jgi:hypothetical protein
MKNVQIIDGAENCTFSIFQFSDEQFALIFSGHGQDMAFADEVELQLSDTELEFAFHEAWDRPVAKSEAVGIHGTIFYQFEHKKHFFPASRRECDWDESSIGPAQRVLNAVRRASL